MRVDGREVELTDQEFRLLHLLATHAGIVFSRACSKIWRGDTCDRPQRRHAGQGAFAASKPTPIQPLSRAGRLRF